ncbi:hypothetical protein U0O11_06460 [Cobetia sp. D5]|uniref:hypothetical protein n=1 Tax=Cobetia sp. D5 TaxID=3105867 RepID=UPI002D79B8CF|nr:hypothetical protein [Cobetia sp. D5]
MIYLIGSLVDRTLDEVKSTRNVEEPYFPWIDTLVKVTHKKLAALQFRLYDV